jgi:hypothetical protein
MKIYPYQDGDQLIELVEKREYDLLAQNRADLLEALERILQIYEKCKLSTMHELAAGAYDMGCIARAAITKTKGES